MGKWLLAGAMMLAGVALVGVPFLVAPAHDAPAQVDAVYVIGPPDDARMEAAWQMIDEGLADHLMISIDPQLPEATFALAQAACAHPGAVVLCSQPDPFSTRGEAEWLRDEAAARGWDSVAVITEAAHISRARMIVKQCFDGQVLMIEPQESPSLRHWVYQYFYQSAATVKALFQGDCAAQDTVVAPPESVPTFNPADASRDAAVDDAFAPGQQVAVDFPGAAAYERAILEASNETRAQRGLDPLEWSDCLAKIAGDRAESVLPTGVLEHAPLSASCSSDHNKAGENLVHGIYLPDQAVAAWTGSAGHRANLLDPEFTHAGVGCIATSLADPVAASTAEGAVGGMLCSMVFEGTGDF